ncbi:hypothetical protein K474DRAFT_1658185 [Panus rudis PR-1116 ss-1]|nr:hypothetical protein K474DRAFT_1658185 [Panus rudis PR-1116 ss-1]
MAPVDDWSDSDDEVLSDSETSVQLGLPDGPIDSPSDVLDAAVSRIGGLPAFLTTDPPFSSSLCKHCQKPMELLVQLWCPLEQSPYDRALYVWGCARGPCQGKEGSVRAWRALRYNDRYAAKLEKQRARAKAKEEAKAKAAREEAAKTASAKVNPFSLSSTTPAFGLGTQIFGEESAEGHKENIEQSASASVHEESDENTDDESEEEELITAMASTNLDESDWRAAPSYPPLYLSTESEYVPKAPKTKVPSAADLEDDSKGGKDGGFAMEGYEQAETDQVFDRFSRRVEHNPEQCVRYDLGGTPLPFTRDAVYDRLFPTNAPKAGEPITVTKAAFTVTKADGKPNYNPSTVPSCPHCGSKRVFEFQLMPNLINVLKKPSGDGKQKQTDEERRKEVESVLKRTVDGELMDWGTCLVFTCEKDCGGRPTAWREEVVLVQWDS